jgi:hypothetical protein
MKDIDLLEENRKAHKELALKDEAQVVARIKNRDAKLAYEEVKAGLDVQYKDFLKTDPIGANDVIRKGASAKFSEWVSTESKLWKAELAYRKAGYRVDCIKNETELRKSALGTH